MRVTVQKVSFATSLILGALKSFCWLIFLIFLYALCHDFCRVNLAYGCSYCHCLRMTFGVIPQFRQHYFTSIKRLYHPIYIVFHLFSCLRISTSAYLPILAISRSASFCVLKKRSITGSLFFFGFDHSLFLLTTAVPVSIALTVFPVSLIVTYDPYGITSGSTAQLLPEISLRPVDDCILLVQLSWPHQYAVIRTTMTLGGSTSHIRLVALTGTAQMIKAPSKCFTRTTRPPPRSPPPPAVVPRFP